jgi:hypothetical protein
MKIQSVGLRIFAFVLGLALSLPSVAAESVGRFEGTVIAEWLPSGREMKLVQDFAYIDRTGRKWHAPAGVIVDGASIPRFAWALIGGPFEGKYREASVIHDVACVQKKESWERVHEVFYEGMRSSGVSESLAKVMYAAVYHFGPRWERRRTDIAVPLLDIQKRVNQYAEMSNSAIVYTTKVVNKRTILVGGGALASQPREEQVADLVIRYVPKPTPFKTSDFEAMRQQIEAGNLSLEEIRALTP